ncbi:MAG: 4Fe-4S dicluster domain-containing protein [Deltaproteobacteria bacterium]|nr:4Fe-4S dicluster domain-containing protein [Deltaproteobacteria bacterium]
MTVFQISTITLLVLSFGIFSLSFGRIVRIISLAKPRNRFRDFLKRAFVFNEHVLLHKKMFRQFVPGLLHFIIFWGFVILTAGTMEWMYYGITGGQHFHFLGHTGYAAFSFAEDLFNFLVFLAVAAAFYRRIVIKPKRMADNSFKSKADAYFILSLIWGLVITNLLTHSISIHNGTDEFAAYQPIAAALAQIWPQGPVSENVYLFFWWAHLAIVLGFLNFLPYSKHFHVIVAAPNVWFSKLEPRGQLSFPNLEDETITKFGAEKVNDLSWKNLLDSYACTECGRCNEFCPTTTTGKELRPKTLMINLRAAVTEQAPISLALNGKVADEAALAKMSPEQRACYEKELVPGTFSDQFIWDCTTCGACVEACPVLIDHVDAIVDMRRALVLNKGSNPEEATTAFRNFETVSNPWGFNESTRQEWLTEKGVPHYEADQNFEFLYYIGCAGSFDDRNKKVVDSVVKILQSANVKFGILGKEEKCNGETVRRMGNEYLGQQMMKANKETLEKYKVSKILTSCPHCFNTLKNEYPEIGGSWEVIHHSEYINELIAAGRIKPDGGKMKNVTYHDSCYIGRYNKIYDEPREIIEAVTKEKPIEMERSKEKGFCCGAGGGRMWMEEKTGTRINVNRAEEVIASKAETVCVACPFCMTMVTDGLKSKAREDIKVRDISEIVAEALP